MFQPAPRRHRRLPSGTMVSYAEVKSYLSKREIPQLFESLMAGLMYHRPENHIGYLQSCLDEVKSNSDTKVQWSTFVNTKKRKSKEILPPLTPKKQDSFSSWSDNSRQSTPLPPISARTRNRTSMEQQEYRNTYVLYHNPPPILAKPKVPVVSVLGGLGNKIDELCERVVGRLRGVVHISTCSMLKTRMTIEGFYRVTSVPACAVVDSILQAMSMVQSANALLGLGNKIDELCERVVGRLRGVVHISTCSMLKTRMTIEGFYRVTSVPACAVVDSILQAMSMVQSANALLVAGFPRNRGDIEEYRSRRVRMDGVILVDFEEEALKRFLEHEVASGVVRTSEIEAELERYKQDIISVAEFYDQQELLTVVMGDQDMEEIIDDLVLAVDKVIETRKDMPDEFITDGKMNGEGEMAHDALVLPVERLERPSTVEIRDATEEDIKSIEAQKQKEQENDVDDEIVEILSNGKSDNLTNESDAVNEAKAVESNAAEDNENVSLEKEEQQENNEIQDVQPTGEDEVEVAKVSESKEIKDNDELETATNGEIAGNKEELIQETENSSKGEEVENKDEIILDSEADKPEKNEKTDNTGDEKSEEVQPIQSEADYQISQTSQLNITEEKELPSSNDKADQDNKSQERDHGPSQENETPSDKEENTLEEQGQEKHTEELSRTEIPDVPLVFAFENINVDYDEIKNLIANDLEMCFIDFLELMRNDGSSDDKFDNDEAMTLLSGILKHDSVSYSNGFFIFKFPFSLLNETVIEHLLKLGDLSFVCKVRENKHGQEEETKQTQEERLFSSSLNEKIRIIFITDDNAIDEIRSALQGMIDNKREDGEILITNMNNEDKEEAKNENQEQDHDQNEDEEQDQNKDQDQEENEENSVNLKDSTVKEEKAESEHDTNMNDVPPKEITADIKDETDGDVNENEEGKDILKDDDSDKKNDIHENEELVIDDKTEESTGKDVEDLISDDTLNDDSKPPTSLKDEENQGGEEMDDTHSQASTLASGADETQREKAVLERQTNIDVETEGETTEKEHEQEDGKATLIRQNTYSAEDVKGTEINKTEESGTKGNDSEKELETTDVENDVGNQQDESAEKTTEEENDGADRQDENAEKTIEEENNGANRQDENTEITTEEENDGADRQDENAEKTTEEENDGANRHDENAEKTTEEENGILQKQIESKSNTEIFNEGENTKDNTEEYGLDNTNKINNEENLEEKNGRTLSENLDDHKIETEISSNQVEEVVMKNMLSEQENSPSEEQEIMPPKVDSNRSQSETETNAEKNDSIDKSDVENKTEDKSEEVVSGENGADVAKDEPDTSNKEETILISEKSIESSEQVGEQLDENREQLEEHGEQLETEITENKQADNEIHEEQVLEQAETTTEEIPKMETETKEESDVQNQNNDDNDKLGENEHNIVATQETQQDEKSSEEHDEVPSEENKKDEDGDKEIQLQEIEDTSKNSNSSNEEKHVTTKKVHKQKHKLLDNDSDSNDENETIETTAEVHAVDCKSPATTEGGNVDNKTTEDKNIESDNVKSEVESSKDESLSVNEDDDVSNKNKQNETVEGKSIVENDNESEILIMEGIDDIGNERLSGKRQERNGSGILDESREHDQREAEEPQERSSSSSRGEL